MSLAFNKATIRVMPDVHVGTGCVIGFTAKNWSNIIPSLIGVDIGCGMMVVELGKIEIDFEQLDKVIHNYIPAGRYVYDAPSSEAISLLNKMRCFSQFKNVEHLYCSLGTLGGGNHFIEIDADEEGNKYLVIHTGSRNIGKQVADIYQNKAVQYHKNDYKEFQKKIITFLKERGHQDKIQPFLKVCKETWNAAFSQENEDLMWLNKKDGEDYLYDMKLAQDFAYLNRKKIAETICGVMSWIPYNEFHTIHNYINFQDNVIRKGAISAHLGERVLIPLNMRDGCIIGIGKGNEDWNYSAPHGAGRIMSRAEARKTLSMNEFENSMDGIYTTTVVPETIDEAPFAYKPAEEIIKLIQDTVEIEKIIKPLYNFKATEV